MIPTDVKMGEKFGGWGKIQEPKQSSKIKLSIVYTKLTTMLHNFLSFI